MTVSDALRWAESVGALAGINGAVDNAPPLPEVAADLLRRLDFPAAAVPPRTAAAGGEAA